MIQHRILESQVEEIASLHLNAFPGFFLSTLGKPFLVQFYKGFINDPTAVVCVDIEDERIAGVAVGTTEPNGFFSRLLKRQFLGFATAAARAVLRDPSALPRLFRGIMYRGAAPGSPPNSALLSSICVHPEAAGRGTGSKLLSEWTGQLAERGCSSAYLTTDAEDNESVNAFYERQGWFLESTFRTREGRPMNVWTWAAQ